MKFGRGRQSQSKHPCEPRLGYGCAPTGQKGGTWGSLCQSLLIEPQQIENLIGIAYLNNLFLLLGLYNEGCWLFNHFIGKIVGYPLLD